MVTISTSCHIINDPCISVHTVYMLHDFLSIQSATISQLQQLLLRRYIPHTCAPPAWTSLPQPSSILFGIHLFGLVTALFCGHQSYKMRSSGHTTPPTHNDRPFAGFHRKTNSCIFIAGAADPGVNYTCEYGVTRLPLVWRTTTPLHWIFDFEISRYNCALVCRIDISNSDWTFRLLRGHIWCLETSVTDCPLACVVTGGGGAGGGVCHSMFYVVPRT
jgi:hypothetical protein